MILNLQTSVRSACPQAIRSIIENNSNIFKRLQSNLKNVSSSGSVGSSGTGAANSGQPCGSGDRATPQSLVAGQTGQTQTWSINPGVPTAGGQLLELLIFKKGGRHLVKHGSDMLRGQQGHGHQIPTVGTGPLICNTRFKHLANLLPLWNLITKKKQLCNVY